MKEPTWYKNLANSSCINLFPNSRPRTFQCTATIETGISDFHKLTVKVLKTFYKKQRPKITHYRNHKNFENGNFRQDLKKELLKFDVTMLHYQNLMTLFYPFLTSTLQKKLNIYVQTIAILWLKNWEKQLWTDQN